uniref:ribosomal protein L16 n=1 Tax=Grateloupia turuturu TaxID=118375 RepID=UPI0027A53AB2|nr:ribosomal protein L16 [Grateloupia turuturu]YP_010986418.1 ribosomal protein L16 [Pachymeniopsis lanceolata]WIM51226.1 ribosomal protein L16 [Grateloupia turuturu]WOL37386.1 ribosomal protein L16 [Pachymeniopsis lanceolata]
MQVQRKTHNKYHHKLCFSNHVLRFGKFGIKVVSFNRISESQLKSLEWSIIRKLKELSNNNKKAFKLWSLVNLNLNLTKLSQESRMGKGKGVIYSKAVFLKPGLILFEFDKISYQQLIEVFGFIRKKIPAKVILIKKEN